MSKKSIKVTTFVICFALLTLVIPKTAHARPAQYRYTMDRILHKPIVFIASLLRLAPIYEIDYRYIPYQPEYDNGYLGKRSHQTGELDDPKVSDGD